MKKVIALILIVSVLFSFAACSKETEKEDGNKVQPVELTEFQKSATIEKQVIYEENGITISADALNYGEDDVELDVTISNNSSTDTNVICGSAGYHVNSVNGYTIDDGYLNCDVPVGNSVSETITFNYADIMAYGITQVADISVGFQITGDGYIFTGPIKVQTSIADSYDYNTDTYEEIIQNGVFAELMDCTVDYYCNDEVVALEGTHLISVAVVSNQDGEPALLMELENESKNDMRIVIRNVCINGKVVYETNWLSTMIAGETRYVDMIDLTQLANKYEGDFSDISTINELSFELCEKKHDTADLNSGIAKISLPKVIVSKR